MDQLSYSKIEENPKNGISFRELMEPLLMLFNYASGQILPQRKFYIAYSIPGGVYGYYQDYEVSQDELNRIYDIIKEIVKNKGTIEQIISFRIR